MLSFICLFLIVIIMVVAKLQNFSNKPLFSHDKLLHELLKLEKITESL